MHLHEHLIKISWSKSDFCVYMKQLEKSGKVSKNLSAKFSDEINFFGVFPLIEANFWLVIEFCEFGTIGFGISELDISLNEFDWDKCNWVGGGKFADFFRRFFIFSYKKFKQ
mgnify:FL=1